MVYRYRKKKKFPIEYLIYTLIVVLFIGYGVMVYSTANIYSTLAEKTAEAREAARGPNLEIIELVDANCAECFNLLDFEGAIIQEGANITSRKTIDYRVDAAKDFMNQYGLTRVPALIITGETNKSHVVNDYLSQYAINHNGTFVMTKTFVPYMDVKTGNIKGIVTLTYLNDSSCTACYDVTINKEILSKTYGVYIKNETTVDISSAEGKNLAKKYNITYLPNTIISSDISEYDDVVAVWANVGARTADGSYIITNKGIMDNFGNYTVYNNTGV